MNYSIKTAAATLLLNTEELKRVFALYFEDTAFRLAECQTAIHQQDYPLLSKILQGISDASINLGMHEIASLAGELHYLIATTERVPNIELYYLTLESAIADMEKHIDAFYRQTREDVLLS